MSVAVNNELCRLQKSVVSRWTKEQTPMSFCIISKYEKEKLAEFGVSISHNKNENEKEKLVLEYVSRYGVGRILWCDCRMW